jgi:hypothetical protein
MTQPMTTASAISAIVAYNTLPPQIDYTLPWQLKARAAQQWIDLRPWGVRQQIYSEINKQIAAYYGKNGAAQYDKLF